ncbi:hypothetical protein ACHAWF_010697 [Thalassiosira exigua]
MLPSRRFSLCIAAHRSSARSRRSKRTARSRLSWPVPSAAINFTRQYFMTMAKRILFVCIYFVLQGATSFSLNKVNLVRTQQLSVAGNDKLTQPHRPSSSDDALARIPAEISPASPCDSNNGSGMQQSLLAGCVTFLTTTPLSSFAESVDDLELAELPPVYVPILFAIGVLGGVGVLTASLGNVMDEEASLGLQSGARAKKERERSRSSYFKK